MNRVDPVSVPIDKGAKVHHLTLDCPCVFDGDKVADDLHRFAQMQFHILCLDARHRLVFDQQKGRIKRELQDLDLIDDLLPDVSGFEFGNLKFPES